MVKDDVSFREKGFMNTPRRTLIVVPALCGIELLPEPSFRGIAMYDELSVNGSIFSGRFSMPVHTVASSET